jgi:uncharacterized membrane protein
MRTEVTLLNQAAELVKAVLEAAGLTAILLGLIITTFIFVRDGWGGEWNASFRAYRASLGRSILIGLEMLVAADIAGTVMAPLNLDTIIALGLIVVIRTVLSLSLEVEIRGRWPWQGRDG